jgi:2-polyprenyl-3-methyl-5-hydroxy-6-metoxy-1,4-benzoquinol methylase
MPEELIWSQDMVKRFWDYESWRPETYFSYQVGGVLVRFFDRYLKGASAIADYGAGPGFLLEDLLADGFKCGAIDLSPASIAGIEQKFGHRDGFIGAWNGDGRLPQKFDVIFFNGVAEHLYDAELDKCLESIRDMLANGGILIVTTPNDEDLSKMQVMSPESGKLFHRWQHVRSFTTSSLAELLRPRGFQVLESGTTDFGVYVRAHRRTTPLSRRMVRSLKWSLIPHRYKPPHLYAVAKKP